MISTTLDQIQKLFGRAFLIAAFVPSLLLVVTVSILWWGMSTVQQTVQAWADQGLTKVIFQVFLAFVAVYVLAYIVYGARSALHQLYRGEWLVIPLKWLAPLFTRLETWHFHHRQQDLEKALQALDDVGWVKTFDFGPTSTPITIPANKAPQLVQKNREVLQESQQMLQKDESLKRGQYRLLLRSARLLQANQDNYDATLQADISQLVIDIREDYLSCEIKRDTVDQWDAGLTRAYDVTYNNLNRSFPGDEYWLRPTRFGNVTGVLEYQTFDRYSIPLDDLWSRLLYVLPEETIQRLVEMRIFLDFALITSFLAYLASIAAFIAAFFGPFGPTRSLLLKILLVVALLLAGRLFYQVAIQANRVIGGQMRAIVDLYNLKLLDALEIERPKSWAEGRTIWGEVYYFFRYGYLPDKPHLRFKNAEEEEEKEELTLWDYIKNALRRLFSKREADTASDNIEEDDSGLESNEYT